VSNGDALWQQLFGAREGADRHAFAGAFGELVSLDKCPPGVNSRAAVCVTLPKTPMVADRRRYRAAVPKGGDWAAADADGDGVLTEDEFVAHGSALGFPATAARELYAQLGGHAGILTEHIFRLGVEGLRA
jgi:hypothetical protein